MRTPVKQTKPRKTKKTPKVKLEDPPETISPQQDHVLELCQNFDLFSLSSNKENVNLNSLQKKIEEIEKQLVEKNLLITELQKNIQEKEANSNQIISNLKTKNLENEVTIRSMYNEIQTLRGTMRVYVRMRPAMGKERPLSKDLYVISKATRNGGFFLTLTKKDKGGFLTGTKLMKETFQFDHIFDASVNQQDLFKEVSQLVQCSLYGDNVTIFAYGMTNSGKTYTILGGRAAETKGIIPLSMEYLFNKRNTDIGTWEYSFSATFVELYNEKLRDLLLTEDQSQSWTRQEVKYNREKKILEGATVLPLESLDDCSRCIEIATANRMTSATAKNLNSSRSHSIFSVKIEGRHQQLKDEVVCGFLNLIDLAGSERFDSNGDEKLRQEQININLSLTSLRDVIHALASNASHVPFRNSTLTTMLQPAMQGDSKTLLLVNVAMVEDCLEESVNSLRFGMKSSKIILSSSNSNKAY